MVNKCTRNSSLRMYFKGHAASNGLTHCYDFRAYTITLQKALLYVVALLLVAKGKNSSLQFETQNIFSL